MLKVTNFQCAAKSFRFLSTIMFPTFNKSEDATKTLFYSILEQINKLRIFYVKTIQ